MPEMTHDEMCERLPDFYICHCSKRARIARGMVELPDLTIQYPICGGCGHEVDHDGESFVCYRCLVTWPTNASDGDKADHFMDDHDWTDHEGVVHTLEEMRERWLDRPAVAR